MSMPIFNIEYWNPLWKQSKLLGKIENPSQVSFQKRAIGGPVSGTITFTAHMLDLEAWLDRLGCHIIIRDYQGIEIWSGFINQVDYQLSFLTVSRGPLMEVYNCVKVVYTPVVDIDPWTTGAQTETVWREDSRSESQYGIREFIVAGGTLCDDLTKGGTNNEAIQLRNRFLQSYKDVSVTQTARYGSNEEIAVTLNLLGYWSQLETYTLYNKNATVNTLTNRITYTLNQDPNGILNNNLDIGTNNFITTSYAMNVTAQEMILQYVSYGDPVDDERWLFSFEENLRAWYRKMPDKFIYVYGKDGVVRDFKGNIVYPWAVRAGEWMFFTDLLSYSTPKNRTVIKDHPAYEFIESVQYNSPFTATFVGSRIINVAQFMARLGL